MEMCPKVKQGIENATKYIIHIVFGNREVESKYPISANITYHSTTGLEDGD